MGTNLPTLPPVPAGPLTNAPVPSNQEFQVEPVGDAPASQADPDGERFVLVPPQPQASSPVPMPDVAGMQIAPATKNVGTANVVPKFEPALILAELQQLRTLTHVSKLAHPNVAAFLRGRELATGAENHLVITARGIVYLADFGLL